LRTNGGKAVAPRQGSRSRKTRSGNQTRTAFLNVPYDSKYEGLYLAFIAGLCGFGLTPHATAELSGSERRLDRILSLIRRCRYSFHDLSRVQLDRYPPATPRFNMPFELGLAVAHAQTRRRRHEWFVFEARPHRLSKSLSDLDGTDPHIHGGTAHGVLRSLANALSRNRTAPKLGELEQLYRVRQKSGARTEGEPARRCSIRGQCFQTVGGVCGNVGKRKDCLSQ